MKGEGYVSTARRWIRSDSVDGRIVRFAFALLILTLPQSIRADESRPPNILLIIADDLGYSDLGCYGNDLTDTPNIDRLAAEGMRFTDAYAMPVCTPSRVAIISGKNPATLHIQHPNPHHRPWGKLRVPRMFWQLRLDEITIAEELSRAGYVSTHIGKWGCGYSPTKQGYAEPPADDVAGEFAGDVNRFERDNPHKQIGRHLRQAVRFIEQNRGKPFFCTFATSMPHTPPDARDDLVNKYRQRFAKQQSAIHPTYAAMCETIDDATGIFLQVLDALRLNDKTVIVFCSDNGGVIGERGYLPAGFEEPVTTNWPLRGEKGSLYEGGIRIPLIVRWPRNVAAGTTCRTPVSCEDFLPTFCNIAGLIPQAADLDGASIVPLLSEGSILERTALYWHHPRYHHSTPASAIRMGRFKLIHFYEDGRDELYDLQQDVGERFNLAEKHPDRAKQLRQELDEWLATREARLPTPNTDHDPQRELIWGRRDRENWHRQFGLPNGNK